MNISGINVKEEELKKFWEIVFLVIKYINNVYVSFFVLLLILFKYVDSGVFENIQEQLCIEVSNFNWNLV